MPAHVRPTRVFSAILLLTILAACTDDVPTGPQPATRGPNALIVPGGYVFTHVSAGSQHTCATRNDGVIECWGDNTNGQAPATKAAASGSFTAVSAGSYSTCGLRNDGVVECWGDNSYGQAPATKTAATGFFKAVSAGSLHTCALRNDGAVECWGEEVYGAPALKTAATGTFTQVSAGYIHSCGLRSDGVVECWGIDNGGNAPTTKAAAIGTFTQVQAAGIRTCARRTDGVVECWGDNRFDQAPPTKVASVGGYTQVSLGFWWSCALRNDGVAECWGGFGGPAVPPTRAAATGKFTELSGIDSHHCALRSDGAVECWGDDNRFGEAPPLKTASAAHVFPTASFSATPNAVVGGQPFTLALANAQVPGHPGVTFTYAFDCGDGNGYGAASASSSVSCPTFAAGTRAVRGKVIDQDNDATEYTGTVDVSAPPDNTPPVIAATISGTLGSNGWYTSDVTVSWTVSDAESPVTSAPCASATISADTQGQTVSCSATSTGGTGSESVTIKRDATAPTLAPTVSPNPVLLNGSATAAPNASDATSGLAASSCAAVTTGAVGSGTVACTASDHAGNTANAQATYSVTYAFAGFDSPVDGGGVLNVAKAGQTIPLKWRLLDAAGNPVTTLSGVTVTVATFKCAAGRSADALEEYGTGSSGLQNLGNGYYQYNWATPKSYAGSCKTLQLNLGEGSFRTALFQFK